MRKDDLRKLRALPATKEMMEKAKNNVGEFKGIDHWGYKKTFKNRYGVFLRIQQFGTIMKVAVFLPKKMQKDIKTPVYEVFLNIEGMEYITRILDDEGIETGWSSAMIENLKQMPEWYFMRCNNKSLSYQNADAAKHIKSLGDEKGLKGIQKWQQKIKDKKIIEAEARQVKPWDEAMNLIPEESKRFLNWMEKEVPGENYIFYTYDRKGAKTGYCTYCGKEVPLAAVPHHRADGKCKICRKKIQYISRGRLSDIWTGTYAGQLISPIENGFAVRKFSVRKHYFTNHPEKSFTGIDEYIRILKQDGKDYERYDYEFYKNKYKRWVKQKGSNSYGYRSYVGEKIYKGNLNQIRQKIEKHSALPIIIEKNVEIDIKKYIQEEMKNQVIEMLVKAGMIKLAIELADSYKTYRIIKKEETELSKKLKLDKQRMNRLKKMNPGIRHLEWIQSEKEENTQYPDDMLKFFADEDIERRDLDFMKNMSLIKIWHYLEKQKDLSGEDAESIVIEWRDYLQMAKKVKMNTDLEQIYKPKNLKEAHAEVIDVIEKDGIDKQAKQRLKEFPKVNEVCNTLGKYEWSDEKYAVIAPKNINDIIREGTLLRHCIHTCDYYFDRMNNRESYLLFLRHSEAPNTPWYTLEVEPGGNIRQKRTTGDNQNADFNKAVGFMKKWQKVIQKRLSDEDKELAKISDIKRQENYSNLKKNGNRIWHGKLQGQLLADVLEQDFMAVI